MKFSDFKCTAATVKIICDIEGQCLKFNTQSDGGLKNLAVEILPLK